MVGDAAYRECVAALWRLVEAVRDGYEHVAVAGSDAARALAAARGSDSYLMLHEQEGALHVNGRQLQLSVEVFSSARGLAGLFAARSVGELMFDSGVDVPALVAWARCWSSAAPAQSDPETELAEAGAFGVHASRRSAEREPMLPLRRRPVREEPRDSRLRSVFLQTQLIAALPVDGPVPPPVAKVVVQAVVDRLLQLPGGLEPLLLLQRDGQLLQRSLRIAVLAVAIARGAGWPDHGLADLGAAALLHDLGAVLDPERPAVTGFAWLLERGTDDFWLRCALVARTWRDPHGATLADAAADGAASVFVAVAAAIAERGRATGDALDDAVARRALPAEFAAVARETLQALAG